MLLSSSVIPVTLLGVLLSTATLAGQSDQDRLQASLVKWEQVRDAHDGNYSYTVRWSSAFGFGHITTIIVRDNKVVERRFNTFKGGGECPKGAKAPVVGKPDWVEKGKELGTHKKSGAADPKNVDTLYADAAKVLKRKLSEHHKRYLKFDKQGLLSYCFVIDRRIMDDAPRVGVMPFEIQLCPKNSKAEK